MTLLIKTFSSFDFIIISVSRIKPWTSANPTFPTDHSMCALVPLLHTQLYLITLVRKALCLDHNGWLYIPIPFVMLFSAMTLNYRVYADDTQLYLSFNSSLQNANSTITTIELCINEIRQWMKSNFLKLNDDKTEFLPFCSHQQLSKINIEHII